MTRWIPNYDRTGRSLPAVWIDDHAINKDSLLKVHDAPYSALVKKEDDVVYAVDSDGKTIAEGVAGVDDAAVIQAAIDHVYGNGGGKVFIAKEEYIINTEITLKSNIILTGDKPTLKHYSGNCIYGVDISNVIISNLKIIDAAPDQHTELGAFACGILIESIDSPVENIKVIGNEISNSVRDGISFSNILSRSSATGNYGLKNILIMENYVHDLTVGVVGSDGNGIRVGRKSDGVIIVNNVVENTIATGILVGSGTTFDYNKNVYIGHNIIKNTKRYGIDVSGLYGAEIFSNFIYNDDATIDSSTYGIFVESATSTKPSYYVNIMGNVVDGVGLYAIYVYSDVDSVVISHNKTRRVLNPTATGARHIYAAGQNHIITHNEIDGSNDGSPVIGIISGSYSLIAYNLIKNVTASGISVRSYSRVCYNYIYGTSYNGVAMPDVTNAVVLGNIIGDVPSGFYGINEWGTSDYNIIENNDVSQITTGGKISTVGANTIVRGNIGYLTENSGTATFSGDGVTTQFTIAHGLVSTPNKVIVTPGSTDAAGDFYVTVDATNIYVNYLSAPPSGTDNVVLYWYAEV